MAMAMTREQHAAYERGGYVVLRGLFDAGANDEHFTRRPYVPDVAAAERQPGR